MIDFDRLAVRRPELAWDLPGGARRLVQRADGYLATVKRGVVTVEDDELTGARPGGVIRGAQTAAVRPVTARTAGGEDFPGRSGDT